MIIDIAFAIILIWGLITGYRRGLISSLVSFLAFIVGIVAALKFTDMASAQLRQWFAVNWQYLPIISFIIIFIGVVVLMQWLANLLEKVAGFLFLGVINRLIGSLLWGVIFVLVFSTVLWFMNQSHLISPELKAESRTFHYIEPLTGVVFGYLGDFVPVLQGLFESLKESFQKIDQHNL